MEVQKPLRIVKFEAEHVKRIKAITIEPSPEKNVVLLTGKNRQGKTSVLDSIWCALGGKSAIPGRPVQDGEESGYVSKVAEAPEAEGFHIYDGEVVVVNAEGSEAGREVM